MEVFCQTYEITQAIEWVKNVWSVWGIETIWTGSGRDSWRIEKEREAFSKPNSSYCWKESSEGSYGIWFSSKYIHMQNKNIWGTTSPNPCSAILLHVEFFHWKSTHADEYIVRICLCNRYVSIHTIVQTFLRELFYSVVFLVFFSYNQSKSY